MAAGAYKAGTRWGIIPGSEGMSSLYGPQYQGVFGAIEPGDPGPDAMEQMRQRSRQDTLWGQQDADWRRRNRLYDDILGGLSNFNSSMTSRTYGGTIPAPAYASTAPIWSQQQINAQAGQQRAQMQAQAANQVRNYATSAAARGFSPMSPLTQFLQATAGQRANIGAAQNETNLNWTAAEGNRAAQQRGEGINAGLYGSYTSALARNRDQQMQAQAMGQSQKMDQYRLLASLLGRA